MTRSNPSNAASPFSPATQDDIISRVVPEYLSRARNAAAQGLAAEGAVWLQAALVLQPDMIDVSRELIEMTLQQNRIADGIALAARLVDQHPQHAGALWHLGYALQLADNHADAISFYERAYAIDPTVPTLRNNLAVAYEIAGREADALSALEEAVAANPGDVEAWINLSRVYPRRRELEHAIAAGKRAVQIAPSNALAQSNYGLALKEAQRWSDARAAAQAAADLEPHTPRFMFNLSILDLAQGNYARGWPGFESRWEGSSELNGSYPRFTVPRWNGEPLRGKTLLLWGEQGFGDALQFCRFVPLLAKQVQAQGGTLVWVVFSALHPLFARTSPKTVQCVPHDGPLPEFDYQFPLLSLPLHFATDADTIPAKRAYLSAEPERAAEFQTLTETKKRLRVGLVWSGSATHQRNMFRSVGLDRYAQAFGKMDNVAFFSLQKDAQQDVAAAREAGFEIADHTGAFESFDDTAAFIDTLDLVISVCTSVAHLAAALGKPTWVLLDVNPHWVWQLERTDSSWYPTATLYRQKHFTQWDPVMSDVARDLSALAAKQAATPRRRAVKKSAE
jgi:tetratricopeptide (TPR) repeat protein